MKKWFRAALFFSLIACARMLDAQDYSGTWCGTTSQGKEITFRVENNRVVWASVDFTIGSGGSSCPIGASRQMSPPVVIAGGRATFGETSTAAPVSWTLTATFSSDSSVSGTLALTFRPLPPFSCSGVIINPMNHTFTATKSSVPLTISPSSLPFGSGGGPGRIAVSVGDGCGWSSSETLSWVTSQGTQGTGSGAARFVVLANTTGASRTGTISINGIPVTITQGVTPETRQLPVVGSTPGNLGSFFRTSLQLHNRSTVAMTGRLVFRRAGSPGSDSDPAINYSIGVDQTVHYADVLPAMNLSGLGSIDVVSTAGGFPVTVARIFNDAGDAGTTGMTEELVRGGEPLTVGATAVLLAPPDTTAARFNVGVRTLGSGATMTVTLRAADGTVKNTISRTYASNFFEQVGASAFAGAAPGDNDSITIRIDSGSAIVYGAATDNKTQDPSLQMAKRVSTDSAAGQTRYLAVAGSAPGNLGSFFRTAVQIHNPTPSPISGRFVYHPGGASGSAGDPSMTYALAPGQTIAYADLLPAMGTAGLGSVDVVSTSGAFPVTVARVFNDGGAAGTTGLTQDLFSADRALSKDTNSALVTPPSLTAARYNIGIRTLDAGASMNVNVVDSSGRSLKRLTKTFPPNFFQQVSASSFIEADVPENGAVTIFVSSGSAIIYGATTDNKTQDPSVQFAGML